MADERFNVEDGLAYALYVSYASRSLNLDDLADVLNTASVASRRALGVSIEVGSQIRHAAEAAAQRRRDNPSEDPPQTRAVWRPGPR